MAQSLSVELSGKRKERSLRKNTLDLAVLLKALGVRVASKMAGRTERVVDVATVLVEVEWRTKPNS